MVRFNTKIYFINRITPISLLRVLGEKIVQPEAAIQIFFFNFEHRIEEVKEILGTLAEDDTRTIYFLSDQTLVVNIMLYFQKDLISVFSDIYYLPIPI